MASPTFFNKNYSQCKLDHALVLLKVKFFPLILQTGIFVVWFYIDVVSWYRQRILYQLNLHLYIFSSHEQ